MSPVLFSHCKLQSILYDLNAQATIACSTVKSSKTFRELFMYLKKVFLCVLKCKSCWPCLKCVLLQYWMIIVWGEKNILSRTFVFLIFACWPRRHIDLSKISAGWHTGAVSVSLWPLHFIFHQSIKLMTAQKPFGILYIFCRHLAKMLKHLPESLKWFSLWLFEPSLK